MRGAQLPHSRFLEWNFFRVELVEKLGDRHLSGKLRADMLHAAEQQPS